MVIVDFKYVTEYFFPQFDQFAFFPTDRYMYVQPYYNFKKRPHQSPSTKIIRCCNFPLWQLTDHVLRTSQSPLHKNLWKKKEKLRKIRENSVRKIFFREYRFGSPVFKTISNDPLPPPRSPDLKNLAITYVLYIRSRRGF